MPSFDVVSKVDEQEVKNAINQVKKEIDTRYDFRGTKSSVEFTKEEITISAEDNMKLSAIGDLIRQKAAKRGIGLRSLIFAEPQSASGGTLKQIITIKQGINTEETKSITKLIKEEKLKKIQAQIQGDQVRITGAKKDDLQCVISLLKEKVDLELQFVNFKD